MIKFNDLSAQWIEIRESALEKIDLLGFDGSYINGKAVSDFEEEFSLHYNSKYSVGVSNGTDGIKLALQVLNLSNKDVVIIPSNTFIADYISVKNIPNCKPTVVLIDHDDFFNINTNQLESFLIHNRDKYKKAVVIPVHLYGHPCDMDKISDLSNKYNFSIIEDCSQSHETLYKKNHLGSFGEMAVYSLYPGKNLGAMGDAGVLTTNKIEYYERLKSLRNYGSKNKYYYDELGHNHRLDSIQSIVLSEKLKKISNWTDIKLNITNRYLTEIKNENVILPKKAEYCSKHSFHIFCLMVDKREEFQNFLLQNKIPTLIHYPIPIHKTNIFEKNDIVFSSKQTELSSEKIVSIPIHPFLDQEEINYIIKTINQFD